MIQFRTRRVEQCVLTIESADALLGPRAKVAYQYGSNGQRNRAEVPATNP